MPDSAKTVSLVTGGGGFIGSNLVRSLLERGGEVHVFLREVTSPWRLKDVYSRISVHPVDLRDRDAVGGIIQELKPHVVYHLATYGGYSKQSDVRSAIETNLEGMVNLLESLSGSSRLKKFVNTGSSSEYGPKSEPMCETDALWPTTPYGITKAAQSWLAAYYAREKKIPIVTLRLLSVYGPYEEPGRLIPEIMKALTLKSSLKLSSPDTKRDFVFVEDVIEAFMRAADAPIAAGEVVNIGGGKEYSIKEAAEIAMKMAAITVPIEWGAAPSRSFDTTRWVSDISKAKALLGWEPRHSLSEGFQKMFAWFRDNVALYERTVPN